MLPQDRSRRSLAGLASTSVRSVRTSTGSRDGSRPSPPRTSRRWRAGWARSRTARSPRPTRTTWRARSPTRSSPPTRRRRAPARATPTSRASGTSRNRRRRRPPSSPRMSPRPTTKSPRPRPTTKSPRPRPTTKSPKPRPTTKSPKPRPTTKSPKPRPTTRSPRPRPTTSPKPRSRRRRSRAAVPSSAGSAPGRAPSRQTTIAPRRRCPAHGRGIGGAAHERKANRFDDSRGLSPAQSASELAVRRPGPHPGQGPRHRPVRPRLARRDRAPDNRRAHRRGERGHVPPLRRGGQSPRPERDRREGPDGVRLRPRAGRRPREDEGRPRGREGGAQGRLQRWRRRRHREGVAASTERLGRRAALAREGRRRVTAGSPDGAPSTATYVYGVVRASEAPKIDAAGVGRQAPVRNVTHGDLTAIVSDVDEGFVEAGREDLERHMAILEQAALSATVVPLRFGTVMPDDDAVTEDLLRARAADFDELFSALDGRVELSLSGTYEERIFGEVVAEQPEVAALRERVRGRDENATYYDRIRLGELVANAMAAKRERDTEQVLARLRPLADDVHVSDVAHERSVLSVSFLVHRDRLPEFDRAAEEVAAQNRTRIRFRYAGPLPPYDFVGGGKAGPWA